MNKKPYNQIEEQMKAAVQAWEPAFDEHAWRHMEQMLEKDDDRKRPFAWWFLIIPILAGIATAGYFGLYRNTADKNMTATHTKVINKPGNNIDTGKIESDEAFLSQQNNITVVRDNTADVVSPSQNRAAGTGTIKLNKTRQANEDITENFASGNKRRNTAGKTTVKITPSPATEQPGSAENTAIDAVKERPISKEEPAAGIRADAGITNSIPDVQKTAMPVEKPVKKEIADSAEKSITQKGKSKQSDFYFSVFGGMEGNGVNFPGLNKFSPRAGFTAGYYFTKNISVQAGFFAGTKKYVAGKNDYKAKPGSYWSTVDITKVDANCRVFEMPVFVRYDINSGNKFTGFAGIGLSSFIMDKEDYEYYYTYYNIPYQGEASYKGNQHWFSVLRLYGGIEKKLSNNFSLGVQPGLSIPLSGVGEGQIKLFSSELLLNLKYRPFKKAKGNQ